MSESEPKVTKLTNGIRVVSDKMESVESVSMGAVSYTHLRAHET